MPIVKESVEQLEPIVTERKVWNMSYLLFGFFLGIMVLISIPAILIYFNLNLLEAITVSAVLIAIYSIILFFLIEPKIIRETQNSYVKTRTIEHSVIKEVPVDRIVERKVAVPVERVVEVERPVEVVRNYPVRKTVYVQAPRKKLDIPKYDYLGSSEAMTYHKHGCRFSKLIKNKYKISNNSKEFFVKKGFKPCEVCMKDQKNPKAKTKEKKK